VDLVVSIGPANVSVPNVVGLSQAAASSAITGAGLTVGTVTSQNSATVPSGDVISQNPAAGASVAPNSAVDLVVSIGPANVSVPNVVGLSQAAASSAITGAGLAVGTVSVQNSDTVPSGDVISQNPAAGASVAPNSAVDLVVSIGPVSTGPTPASLNLTLSQLVIGAAGTVTITPQVLDSGGNEISPSPSVDYQILFDASAVTGTTPTVSGNQVTTSADTRGSFTIQGTVSGTSVTSQIVFTAIQNATQSANSGLYVTLAAAQSSLVQNLAAITDAVQSGNTAAVPALNSALTATAATVDAEAMSVSIAYDPDSGFVPTAAQLASHGYGPTAADAGFATLTAQIRTKIGQITQLLNQPTGNDAADTTTLGQYASDLQTLFDQMQLAANQPTVYGLANSSQAVNDLLSLDMPKVLLATANRVTNQLQQAGLASLQLDPQTMYGMIEDGGRLPQSPQAMYGSARPVFLLTGLLGYAGVYGKLIEKLYGDYLDQLQKMYILLEVQGLLNQFLSQTAGVDGLIAGSGQSFFVYHWADSIIETTGVTVADAQNADVFLIGGAAVNAVSGLIDTFKSVKDIKSIKEVYDFYKSVLDQIHNAGEAYNQAHQQPNFVIQASFDDGTGCFSSLASSCVELHYNNGFNYVGSGGPLQLEPVIILVRARTPQDPQFGSAIFNFAGN